MHTDRSTLRRRHVDPAMWLGSTFAMAAAMSFGSTAYAQIAPALSCDLNVIGSIPLVSDLPTLPTTTPPNDTSVTVISAATGTAAGVPYCLVRLRVQPAINIVVGLPMDGQWNGRLRSEGGGGYAGNAGTPTAAIAAGYVGVTTDTGHAGGGGSFGLASPGVPNTQLQIDFAYRSEHLMAVLGKQLSQAFYGMAPVYSYWNGCSTGGRQGLRMAQDFPNDYDGMVANAPAIHWDRFIAAEIWPQVAMRATNGGVVPSGKLTLATNAAIASCDASDSVVDGLLSTPAKCPYSPVNDSTITRGDCAASDNTCLSTTEAIAIQQIWEGPKDAKGKSLWFGLERGASLTGLAGTNPFSIAVDHGRYWVELDPTWDWKTLTPSNYEVYFNKAISNVGPMMASDNPDLSAFRDKGGKIITMHGLADQLIFPGGTSMYYDDVTRLLGGGPRKTQEFFRYFEAPGVGHCAGGAGPQPQGLFDALVDWVENGIPPDSILASRTLSDGSTMSRPLCPYPAVAKYKGSGSTNDASNFVCTMSGMTRTAR